MQRTWSISPVAEERGGGSTSGHGFSHADIKLIFDSALAPEVRRPSAAEAALLPLFAAWLKPCPDALHLYEKCSRDRIRAQTGNQLPPKGSGWVDLERNHFGVPLRRNDAIANGVPHQIRQRAKLKFAHDVGSMGLDGFRTHM